MRKDTNLEEHSGTIRKLIQNKRVVKVKGNTLGIPRKNKNKFKSHKLISRHSILYCIVKMNKHFMKSLKKIHSTRHNRRFALHHYNEDIQICNGEAQFFWFVLIFEMSALMDEKKENPKNIDIVPKAEENMKKILLATKARKFK